MSSTTNNQRTCVQRTCVSSVNLDTHFYNLDSRKHDVTRVLLRSVSWNHDALSVVRRLYQSENKCVYQVKNETMYHCIHKHVWKHQLWLHFRQFLNQLFTPRFIFVVFQLCLTVKLDNKIRLNVFPLLYSSMGLT